MYDKIRGIIESERRASRFLYLFPDYKLLWYVHEWFRKATQRILFGVVPDLERNLLETRVVDPNMRFVALETALQ